MTRTKIFAWQLALDVDNGGMKKLRIALIYNAYPGMDNESPEDRGGMSDLVTMIRAIARALRKLGHKVQVLHLADDLFAFQRKLRWFAPDVVFNQYDDVVHGALYEMRVTALIQMMGIPLTGSPSLALGLSRYKYMSASLLHGGGVPIPDDSRLLHRAKEVDEYNWNFPVIVQPSQEHAGIGTDRKSVVYSKTALKARVSHILRDLKQPAIAQKFLPGREFNVSVLGGNKLRVLPLAEVDYSELPGHIPPIMSYAAKFLENTIEYQNIDVICPAVVDTATAKAIETTALRAFRSVGGWGYGRVDIRLDEEGRPRVLEVNCNPCLEEDVALARSALHAGIDYPHLLQRIVEAALERTRFDVSLPMINSSGRKR
jgi:D-alanine-D-alanine ligase